MSGSDAIVINTRERASSGDINDLQSLKDRTLLDLLRPMLSRRSFAIGLAVTEAARNVCLGGFLVAPSGVDVTVSAGMILQESLTLAPAPGALDSSYRLALLKAPATETPPAPGVETFYLLEAQMVEVVASSLVVDIFDTGTGLFVPTLSTKRRERVPAFQFVAGAGANAPAPSGGDWVPIAIVRRPPGGGPVLVSDIIDVRPMWDAIEGTERDSFSANLGRQGDRRIVTSTLPGAAASNLVLIEAEARVLGQRLWFFASAPIDVTSAPYLDTTTVLVADTWFYLYLVPWQGLAPVDPRVATRTGKGLLVLSSVSPTSQGDVVNGVALNLPPPFGVATVAANGATAVAALRRNSLNTGWVSSATLERTTLRISPPLIVGTFLPMATPQALALGPLTPNTAKAARVQLRVEGNGVAGNVGQILIGPTGAVVGYKTVQFDDSAGGTFEFDLPMVSPGSTSFDMRYVGIAAPDVVAEVIGWTE